MGLGWRMGWTGGSVVGESGGGGFRGDDRFELRWGLCFEIAVGGFEEMFRSGWFRWRFCGKTVCCSSFVQIKTMVGMETHP